MGKHALRRAPAESDREYLLRVKQVDALKGCWLWPGAVDEGGYGRVLILKQSERVHRISFVLFKGAIPEGLVVDHECRVRRCYNPDHLRPMTNEANLAISPLTTMGKVICKWGHRLEGVNVRIRPDGRRTCRTCKRASDRRLRSGT